MLSGRTTMQIMIGSLCALIALLGPAQGKMACATQPQRETAVQRLNENIDWFLSVVEEVPEGVARRFRDVDVRDEKAVRQAITHPLWGAYRVRYKAVNLKSTLVPDKVRDSRELRVKKAISALTQSVYLVSELSDYADANLGGRIVDIEKWNFNSTVLPGLLEDFAFCLVDDLVAGGANLR
jgi:hypothetical protein